MIIAEEITSRFFNVIQLFNRHIPLIAIQMTAVKIPNQPNDQNEIGIIFTKVLDTSSFDFDENDESLVDRNHWINRSREAVEIVDCLIGFCKSFTQNAEPNYTNSYISIVVNRKNFAYIKDHSRHIRLEIYLPKSDELESEFKKRGIDIRYNERHRQYRLKLTAEIVNDNRDFLEKILKQSYEHWQER